MPLLFDQRPLQERKKRSNEHRPIGTPVTYNINRKGYQLNRTHTWEKSTLYLRITSGIHHNNTYF
jgi:hypothetical protein